jgi:hypothetical protein
LLWNVLALASGRPVTILLRATIKGLRRRLFQETESILLGSQLDGAVTERLGRHVEFGGALLTLLHDLLHRCGKLFLHV